MENTIKVAIGDKFFDSFAALPRQIQDKVTEFINKFRNNPSTISAFTFLYLSANLFVGFSNISVI